MGLFFDALKKHKKEKSTSTTVLAAIEKEEAYHAKTKHDVPSPQPSAAQPEQVPENTLGGGLSSNYSKKIDKNLVSIKKPYSMEAELFKVLRGKILFPVSGNPPRSILVTSAVPGDGKSFIASNLAVNMAQNIGETVLLVDCDLRRPCIHKNFGFNHVKGLSEHLSNHTKLGDLLLKTMVDKLTLLPAGTPPANPSEILSSAKMADLIDELKSRYDDRYLIIDSPPPMMAPETSAIAKRVDGIIVVIKCGSTPLDLLDELIENLGKEKILGAVINHYDMPSSRYYGHRKYSKYYKNIS
jgi:protein-tyrosine kinase